MSGKQSWRLGVMLGAATLLGATQPASPPPAPALQAIPSLALRDACKDRDGWSDAAPPAHIQGSTWYVGTCGITVLLVATGDGLVLIDSGPADAAPLVLANIRALGFDPRRVRWILSSHEHDDHAGGLAELKRATGARLALSRASARVMESGQPDPSDPQFGVLKPMPAIKADRVLRDGDTIVQGGVTFTARLTPTHSPGSTSWSWQSCMRSNCRAIAYADSATTISADAYRFSDHPDRVAAARRGLATMRRLPCDILVTPHPSASDLFDRLSGEGALEDHNACRAYADAASARLDRRLASENPQTAKAVQE